MNMIPGQYIAFGDKDNQVYGRIEADTAGRLQVIILPACSMRMPLEAIRPEWVGDLLPTEAMADFIQFWDKNGAIDVAERDVLELYHIFADRLSEIDDPIGLAAKAYGCYGGYNSFECDWETSRDCLLRLLEVSYKPFYADTLGYIYYYGRCNGGIPQYEEAFKYFSMAAFGGNYEAMYKIADMFFNGYYVQRDYNTAISMVQKLYDDNLPFIMRGEFLSGFADIALRMGKMLRQILDMNCRGDANEVYRYLLQAEYAIRMRIATYDQSYGDEKVLQSTMKAVREVREICRLLQDPEEEFLFTIGLVTLSMPKSTIRMHAEYGDTVKLHFTPEYDDYNHLQPRFLLTIPDNDYCGLCDELVFSVEKQVGKLPEEDILFDRIEGHDLYFGNCHVAKIDSCFELISPDINNETVYRIVTVRYERNSEPIDFICEEENIKVGEYVIVPSDNVLRRVKVEKVSERKESELAYPIKQYQRVIRKDSSK